jgi:hypothetical protein
VSFYAAWECLLCVFAAQTSSTSSTAIQADYGSEGRSEQGGLEQTARSSSSTKSLLERLEISDLLSFEVHAFVSPGYIKTTSNNYLAPNTSNGGSPEFSEIGINVTRSLTDELRFGLELYARVLGTTGSFDARFTWFFLDYHWRDWLGFRAGRVKLPFGLYNEVTNTDAAHTPVLLPQSIYDIHNREFLLAQTGAELYGLIRFGVVGDLEYRGYAGSILLTAPSTVFPIGPTVSLVSFNVPYIAGGRIVWNTPVDGLRGAFSLQTLRFDSKLQLAPAMLAMDEARGIVPAGFSGLFSYRVPAVLWVGSIEYTWHDLMFAAEYSRWYLRTQVSPAVLPETFTIQERLYGMVSYQLTHWLQPCIYYSLFYPDTTLRTGPAAYQHDLSITLRFDINAYWLFKMEAHYMHGTASVESSLNGNEPLSMLTSNWVVLLAKTTLYF